MSSVLDAIVRRTRADVAARAEARALAEIERRLEPSAIDFAGSLSSGRRSIRLIAELKPRSPSRGVLRPNLDVRAQVSAYGEAAAAISVLCDAPYFGGSFALLSDVRSLTATPILAKDFVVGRYQIAEARAAGASSVLLMCAVLDDAELGGLLAYARALRMEPLVESHTDDELERALAAGALVVGVNARDLHTLAIDTAAMWARLERVPAECVAVAESGTETRRDVAALRGRADAVLVGTALMTAPDVRAAMAALGVDGPRVPA